MITALKYLPILFSTSMLLISMMIKLLFDDDIKITYLLRDLVVFLISYYILQVLVTNIIKIFRNYWKIL